MFMVHGGVYTDTKFERVVEGTQEAYGPFETYEQAVSVWRSRMGWNIDICEHRLFVEEADALSQCRRCGTCYPSSPLGTIHKCGKCSGGYCERVQA